MSLKWGISGQKTRFFAFFRSCKQLFSKSSACNKMLTYICIISPFRFCFYTFQKTQNRPQNALSRPADGLNFLSVPAKIRVFKPQDHRSNVAYQWQMHFSVSLSKMWIREVSTATVILSPACALEREDTLAIMFLPLVASSIPSKPR